MSPTYVETTEGFVKTYERTRSAPQPDPREGSAHGSDQPSSARSRGQDEHDRRSTQQTLKMYDDTRPTSTSGPSFGHFGRPFSHQIDGIEQLLQATSPFDSFPVDSPRIVLMQRTVNAKPGFGIPVSALGEFGIGPEAFSASGLRVRQPELMGEEEESVKRSAYVETVSDEDVSLTASVPYSIITSADACRRRIPSLSRIRSTLVEKVRTSPMTRSPLIMSCIRNQKR